MKKMNKHQLNWLKDICDNTECLGNETKNKILLKYHKELKNLIEEQEKM